MTARNRTWTNAGMSAHVACSTCRDNCVAARASQRLYGRPDAPIGARGMARQRLLDAQKVPPVLYSTFQEAVAVDQLQPQKQPISDRFRVRVVEYKDRQPIYDLEAQFQTLAEALDKAVADSRPKSLALTALEESFVWAIKAMTERVGK